MSTTLTALIHDIPTSVGPIQRFLFACAEHGRRTGKVKTLRVDGEASLILSQTGHLRRMLRVSGAEYWIARNTVANETLRKSERLARKRFRRKSKPLWAAPSWTGEPRPNADTVLLGGRTLSWAEIVELVDDLGFPFYGAVVRGSLPPPIPDSRREKTRAELGEIVKTPFNKMSPAQRWQKQDHDKLMKVLADSRIGSEKASALYNVIVLGHEVRSVAESRGLNAKSLAVTVSRVKTKMN
jgi:hypothetical protein